MAALDWRNTYHSQGMSAAADRRPEATAAVPVGFGGAKSPRPVPSRLGPTPGSFAEAVIADRCKIRQVFDEGR